MLCISVKTKVSNVHFNQCERLRGCQETSGDFIPPVFQLWEHLQSAQIKDDIYAGRSSPLTRITVALSVKVSSRCKYSMTAFVLHSQSNFKALRARYGNLEHGLYSLIFWSTKLSLELRVTFETESKRRKNWYEAEVKTQLYRTSWKAALRLGAGAKVLLYKMIAYWWLEL